MDIRTDGADIVVLVIGLVSTTKEIYILTILQNAEFKNR